MKEDGTENRSSLRKSLALDIVIGYNAIGFVKGRTRNISLGGMLVETGCIQLPLHAMVEVSFSLDQDQGPIAHQTSAVVVHSSSPGAGLMFDNLDEKTHRALNRYISEF